MKLLSICIPTYNRPDKLKELYTFFIQPALKEYGDQIEVVVRDNSNDEISRINQSVINSEVHYYKNETNLGFSGSLIRLVKDANGQFIWIISDDDLILWSGFRHLMDILSTANKDNIDCLLLAINYRNSLGEIIYYEGNAREDIDLKTYVTTLSTVPFGYFSASVIRLDKNNISSVINEFKDNIIINIPLFLTMLKPESKLRFLNIPIIEYVEKYYIRMDIMQFYTGDRKVILFLEREYGLCGAMLIDHTYKESLLMMIAHIVGLRIYLNGEKSRKPLLNELNRMLSFKALMLALMINLPGSFVKVFYLFYLSMLHARSKEKFSIREVISRFKVLNYFIQSKANERKGHHF